MQFKSAVKELNADTSYNMDEVWKYFVVSKKPTEKTYKKYCIISLLWNIQNKQILRDRKINICQELDEGCSGCRISIWSGDECLAFASDDMIVTQHCEYT